MSKGAVLEIKRRVAEKGRVTFAEFMDVALFWPEEGYYSSPRRVGPEGDFYTAPGTHPVFGALIASQLEQMWQALGSPSEFHVVEMGAGGGLLCRDILEYTAKLSPDFQRSLTYLLLDRSVGTGGEQAALRRPAQRILAEGLPLRGIVGCLLSNELVDSFPVHRVVMRGGKLMEVYVALEGDSFVEAVDEPSTPLLERRLGELGIILPDGFRTEVCLALDPWAEQVAAALDRGFVITIDYGHPAEALYSPERSRGTLRCYFKHTLGANPYVRVGEQDITAHVDFTSLMRAGERVGLNVMGIVRQREFLMNLGLGAFIKALAVSSFGPPVIAANRMAMQELARPGGMGDFWVLVQSKGVPNASLYGLQQDNPLRRRLEDEYRRLEAPLATAHHVPLLEGRYPHEAFDWQGLWPFGQDG